MANETQEPPANSDPSHRTLPRLRHPNPSHRQTSSSRSTNYRRGVAKEPGQRKFSDRSV
jgi:hypothetical protein